MNQWDYKIVSINTQHQPDVVEWISGSRDGNPTVQKTLESMGNNGWELVAFFPARPADQTVKHPVSEHNSIVPANPWLYHAIFKKPSETMEERQQRVESERLERRAQRAKSRL
jgi:hypothetical protein